MSLGPHPFVGHRGAAPSLASREHAAKPWSGPPIPNPLESTLSVIAGRTRTLIVWSLFWGPRPFCDRLRAQEGLTKKTLRHELSELERCGLVRREMRRDAHRKVEYALTAFGETLKPLIAAMYEWGLRFSRVCGLGIPSAPAR